MAIRTLQLALGTLDDPPAYTSGWYRDPNTGQYYYYAAETRTWYIYSAGYLYPLSIAWETAPKVVDIARGDTLRIEYSYKYSGPAVTVEEYAAVGVYGWAGLDEKVAKSKTYNWPETTTPTERSSSLDIVLPSTAETNWDDIYAKVCKDSCSLGGYELGLGYENALDIVTVEAEFSEFAIVDYARV
jgi:hypothetical protein